MCCCCQKNRLFFIPLLLARSPATTTTTAAVAQSLTTNSPVTQLNFHSFRLCTLHTPLHTLYVSVLIPHHPLVSLLRYIEYSSVEQHPRLLQHLHRRQVGREEVQVRDYCCRRPGHHRRETLCMLLLFFVRPNTSCIIHIVVHTQCFFCCLSAYINMLCFLRFFTFHPVPSSDGCRICPLWQQNDTIKKFCLPHSSTFFCLVYVTLPSFSSFSLYVVPSFCHFLSTFVLARFCRYCRCSSCVVAAFSVPRPFRPAFRASRCYLCAPFAFFSVAFCFIFQQSQNCLLYTSPSPRDKRQSRMPSSA